MQVPGSDRLRRGSPLYFTRLRRRSRKPALTLGVYAHAMHEAESDLSFADFGAAPRGPQAAPADSALGKEARNRAENLVELGGIEPPTLRLPA